MEFIKKKEELYLFNNHAETILFNTDVYIDGRMDDVQLLG